MSQTIAHSEGSIVITRGTAGATATPIMAATDGAREAIVINNSAAVMDLGGSAVAPGNGIPIQPNGGWFKLTIGTGSKGAWYVAYSGGGGDYCLVEAR